MYTPVKKSSRNRPKGRLKRNQFDSFDKGIYHFGRNPVELTMFLLNHIEFTVKVRKIKNKIKQVVWKIFSFNIEQLAKIIKLFFFRIFWDKAKKTKPL